MVTTNEINCPLSKELIHLSVAGLMIMHRSIKDPRTVRRRLQNGLSPPEEAEFEKYFPRTRKFYKRLEAGYFAILQELHILRRSPAFLGSNPDMARRRSKAHQYDGGVMRIGPFTKGEPVLQVHFYSNKRRGTYHVVETNPPEPDVIFELCVHSRRSPDGSVLPGADLSAVREELGLETFGFLRPHKHRDIFEPANEDRLSVLAAYNISKGFTVPIRMCETDTSIYTTAKRRLSPFVYHSYYFIWSHLRLLAGFPLGKGDITAHYGSMYAAIYTFLSLFCILGPLVQFLLKATAVIAWGLICLPYLIVTGAYKYLLPALLRCILDGLDFALNRLERHEITLRSIKPQGYAFFAVAVWFLYAEYRHTSQEVPLF